MLLDNSKKPEQDAAVAMASGTSEMELDDQVPTLGKLAPGTQLVVDLL